MGDLTVTCYKKLTEHHAELVEGGDGVTGYKRLLYGYHTVIIRLLRLTCPVTCPVTPGSRCNQPLLIYSYVISQVIPE